MAASQAISRDEGHELLEEIVIAGERRDLYTALTLFGACGIKSPSPEQERSALESAARVGLLSDLHHRELDPAIGQPQSILAGVLQRLVSSAEVLPERPETVHLPRGQVSQLP